MIFITDELGKFEKNIIELAENVGFKECKTIEAIDLFCGISERNDVLKETKHQCLNQCKYLSKYKCLNKCKYIGKYKCLNKCK